MIALLVGAAVLGIIIAVMEEDEFPGWFNMFLCVLAANVPMGLVAWYLEESPVLGFILGPIVGAITGGLAISALCGMSARRASIAAGIYLAFELSISLIVHFAF